MGCEDWPDSKNNECNQGWEKAPPQKNFPGVLVWKEEPPKEQNLPGIPDSSSVDHPAHYSSGGMEAIDVIEAFGLGFNLGNVVKYVLRAGRKTVSSREDLEKAKWYLERELGKKG